MAEVRAGAADMQEKFLREQRLRRRYVPVQVAVAPGAGAVAVDVKGDVAVDVAGIVSSSDFALRQTTDATASRFDFAAVRPSPIRFLVAGT